MSRREVKREGWRERCEWEMEEREGDGREGGWMVGCGAR